MVLLFKSDVQCVADRPTRGKHINHADSLGLPEFTAGDTTSGAVSLVCSGPTLADYTVPTDRPIFAVNGAHDYLIMQGITPTMSGSIDPLPRVLAGFHHPSLFVKYYFASQCHPDLFRHFQDYDVTLFHMLGKYEWDLLSGRDKLLVGGGSSSGLRIMVLLYMMGFREFHIYGMDCCFFGERRNVGVAMTRAAPYNLIIHGRRYESSLAMAHQADEFADIVLRLQDATFNVYGDGALGGHIDYWKETGEGERFNVFR